MRVRPRKLGRLLRTQFGNALPQQLPLNEQPDGVSPRLSVLDRAKGQVETTALHTAQGHLLLRTTMTRHDELNGVVDVLAVQRSVHAPLQGRT